MKKTIEDISVSGKKVLLRCDLNVPLDAEKNITDTARIDKAMPTINYLLEHDAKIVLMSHLGRPKGKVNPDFSLEPVYKYMKETLGLSISFATDTIGDDAKNKVSTLNDHEIVLLENLRFDNRETDNDDTFAKELANFGDIYVNDAFGTAHRAHASTVGVTKYLPSVSGYLMGKEIEMLSKAVVDPSHPYVAIMGGAKVSDKIPLINNLISIADKIVIGGGMAYTFIKALGGEIANSLLEADLLDDCLAILEKAKENNTKIILPIDCVAGKEFSADTQFVTCPITAIPEGYQGLDIGPATVANIKSELAGAKTVIWNGPLGVFEFEKFAVGTQEIAKALADLDSITIIGGGDSASAVKKLGLQENFTHISTGGGASLEFIEGKELPGVAALEDK